MWVVFLRDFIVFFYSQIPEISLFRKLPKIKLLKTNVVNQLMKTNNCFAIQINLQVSLWWKHWLLID